MSTALRILFVAFVLGIVGALLFGKAEAQVTDKPITTSPMTWAGRVVDVTPAPFRACVAGWTRDTDRYGDWLLAVAFVDYSRMTATQIAAHAAAFGNGDLAALSALHTVNVSRSDPAVAPCIAKLTAPAPVWQVASLASGKRPAYLLGADGKRGAQSGTADVKLSTGEPMPCNCKVRSVETTTSTYCTWMMARQTVEPTEPTRVTLCRENK